MDDVFSGTFAHWGAKRSEAYQLLREQGVAGSNPVIPTSVYKERPSRGRSSFLSSGAYPVQTSNFPVHLERIGTALPNSGPQIFSGALSGSFLKFLLFRFINKLTFLQKFFLWIILEGIVKIDKKVRVIDIITEVIDLCRSRMLQSPIVRFASQMSAFLTLL